MLQYGVLLFIYLILLQIVHASSDTEFFERYLILKTVKRFDIFFISERPTLLSTIGNNKTIASSRQPSSHKHEAQNESPPLSSLMTEKTELPEPTRSAANTHPVKINHPMTLGHSLSQEYDLNSSRSPGSLAKVKGKKWKEAEDVAATTVDRFIKSPRKISVPFHLDLASADMADAASSDVEEVLESPSASLHRISSTGAFQSTQADGSRLDPYKLLERSQSDASLLKRVSVPSMLKNVLGSSKTLYTEI